MLRPRTLKILGFIILAYFLVLLPGFFAPSYLDSPVGFLLGIPLLSIYLFHQLGIPGLLEHGGACDWGWCPPTTAGWLLAAIVWLVPIWLLAWAIGSMTAGKAGK